MKVYKTLIQYANINGIHLNTAIQRKGKRLQKLEIEGKKVGYIDIYETLQDISILINK